MNALTLQSISLPGRLHDISLALPQGALVGLVGPNGAGKSTLLQVAAGLLPAPRQAVQWSDRPVEDISIMERARCTAWVPQEAHFEFGFSVRAVVQQGRYAHGDDEQGVEEALERFELMALAKRPVNHLSGGERQRVMLARAAVTRAPLQLWDEPLAPLDPRHGLKVLAYAEALKKSGGTVLMSLHDLRVAYYLDRVVVLSQGGLQAVGRPHEVLTRELLHEVFGVKAEFVSSLVLRLP